MKMKGAWLLFGWFPACFAAAADISTPKIRTVSSGDMLHWTVGLIIVLAVFFLCAWGVRKLSGMTAVGTEKMRVVGGLSLGVREKVILLQVGKKQLVLGITPGRIDTLYVLEGDDCLSKEQPPTTTPDGGFAQKLMQAMKGRNDG